MRGPFSSCWSAQRRFAALLLLCLAFTTSAPAFAQEGGHFYIANVLPPDDYVALRSDPSSQSGRRVAILPNGELVDVLARLGNGWWRLHVVASGAEGWAMSGGGGRQWIVCCRAEPASAQTTDDASYFHTPSNNIHCMGSNYDDGPVLRCDLRQMSNRPPPAPADCPESYGDSYAITKNGQIGTLFCHGDTVELPGSPTLDYGQTWRAFGFTCQSTTAGVTCANRSGHGFFVSRDKQSVF